MKSKPATADKTVRKLYRDHNLQIIFGVTLMVVLGVSSISPAFPTIMKAFKINVQQVAMLITIFTLPGILLTPLAGVIADRIGRKVILVPSLILFGISGTACFFCTDFSQLLLLRFIQGIGAASPGTLYVTIIGDLYTGKDRTAAMGYNSSVLSLGTLTYPAMGGALAMIGWQYPFLLPALAIPIGLLVLFFLDNPEPKNSQHIRDYLWSAWNIVKQARVIGLLIATMVTFIIIYGALLSYLPIFMNKKFGSSAFIIGMFISSISISNAIVASQLQRLTHRYSEKTLIRAGFIFYIIALPMIPFMPSIWLLLIPALLIGAANGINIPSILSLLAGEAPINHRGVVMSVNGLALRMGQALGPLLLSAFVMLWDPSIAYVLTSIVVLLSFPIILRLIRK